MFPEKLHSYLHNTIVQDAPERSGLLYLYELDRLLWVDWSPNVQIGLLTLQSLYADATHFGTVITDYSALDGITFAQKIRNAHALKERKTSKKPIGFSVA